MNDLNVIYFVLYFNSFNYAAYCFLNAAMDAKCGLARGERPLWDGQLYGSLLRGYFVNELASPCDAAVQSNSAHLSGAASRL